MIGGARVTLKEKSGRAARIEIVAEETTKIDAPIRVKTGQRQAVKGLPG